MTDSSDAPSKPDIQGRDDLVEIVDAFYGRIREDDILGFIFDEIAQVHWDTHLPKMYNFWDTVMFRSGMYRGNPLAAHARLVPLTEMGRDQFDQWLRLFLQTVDDLYAGENAEHIKACALDMANVIHARINHVQDARFDPANLTPEQRERYAAYRGEGKATTTV